LTRELLHETTERMDRSCDVLRGDLASIRAGRASPALLEKLTVDYYGAATPLQQLATISAPEARLLVVQPWDRSILPAIEKAIQKSDLGLTPTNDGQVIRLVIPSLTEERRRELVKTVRKRGEDEKVVLRNLRREVIDRLKAMVKEGSLSEDEGRRAQEEVQRITDQHVELVDRLIEQKEKEVLEV